MWLAADGLEAVEAYLAHLGGIDMVLLDPRTPGPVGAEILAAIRGLTPGLVCCFRSGDLGGYAWTPPWWGPAVPETPPGAAGVADLIHSLLTPAGGPGGRGSS